MALGTMADSTGSVLRATPHTIFTIMQSGYWRCSCLGQVVPCEDSPVYAIHLTE